MNSMISSKYLNKKGLCEFLGVSIGKVENLMYNGDLKYVKFGRNVRFDVEDVIDFMNNRKINSNNDLNYLDPYISSK